MTRLDKWQRKPHTKLIHTTHKKMKSNARRNAIARRREIRDKLFGHTSTMKQH